MPRKAAKAGTVKNAKRGAKPDPTSALVDMPYEERVRKIHQETGPAAQGRDMALGLLALKEQGVPSFADLEMQKLAEFAPPFPRPVENVVEIPPKKGKKVKEPPPPPPSRKEQLNGLIATMNARRPGTIVSGTKIKEVMAKAGRVRTYLPSIDLLLGGGFPRSKQMQLFGESGSGKSSLMLHTIAENQRRDPDFLTVVVNIEGYWNDDTSYTDAFGVDRSRIHLVNDRKQDEALDTAVDMIESGIVDLVFVDSIGSVINSTEQAKTLLKNEKVANKGVLLDRFSRKLNAALQTYWDKTERDILPNRTCVLLLNQMRTAGIGSDHTYRAPASEGGSVKFNLALSVGAFEKEPIKFAFDEEIFKRLPRNHQSQAYFQNARAGQRSKFFINKTRMAGNKGHEAYADLYSWEVTYPTSTGFTGFGFDYWQSLYDAAMELGLLQMRSAGHYYFGEHHWHGEGKVMKDLRTSLDLQAELRAAVEMEVYGEILQWPDFA